uniref:RNA transcription, translation and transport factor protein n=1 Tax=Phallusia mammillata TaxID=59560 RepID=A0A6F9DQV0_9ASCI|nr:UPF0568 protein C14orf166 homolog [Phallusia mammillata]
MFRRKLAALNHPRCEDFNPSNEESFKNLIVWLEDQKIRHYKIEDRTQLRNISSKQWEKSLAAYLKALDCPFEASDSLAVTDWLLGYAVRLEYGDNVKEYQAVDGKSIEAKRSLGGQGTLNSIKSSDPDFKQGVRNLAKILEIPLHEDDTITLEAVRILVKERLSKHDKPTTKNTDKKITVPLDEQELGFDTGDALLNRAARALRLLHINELRQLQTDINNAVVAVQTLTANPKTDERLGKVGRM